MGIQLTPEQKNILPAKLKALQADKEQLEAYQKEINGHVQSHMAQQPQNLTQRLQQPFQPQPKSFC